MPEFPDPSAPVEPADLTRAVETIQEARRLLHVAGPVVHDLVDAATAMLNEITVLRGTVQAYREDLEDADAYEKLGERDLARSVRLEWSSIRAAVNPQVHTGARTIAYLESLGWVQERVRRGGEVWRTVPDEYGDSFYVFVPVDTSFVDWDKRMAELAHDVADRLGVGELGVLAGIAAAEPEASR